MDSLHSHTQDMCCGCICNPTPAGVETGEARGSIASQSNQNSELSEKVMRRNDGRRPLRVTSILHLHPRTTTTAAPPHMHTHVDACAHAQNSGAAGEKPKPDLKIRGKQTWVFTSKHLCLSNVIDNNNNKTCFLAPYFPASLNKNQAL